MKYKYIFEYSINLYFTIIFIESILKSYTIFLTDFTIESVKNFLIYIFKYAFQNIIIEPIIFLYQNLPTPFGWGGLPKDSICSQIKNIDIIFFQTSESLKHCHSYIFIDSLKNPIIVLLFIFLIVLLKKI